MRALLATGVLLAGLSAGCGGAADDDVTAEPAATTSAAADPTPAATTAPEPPLPACTRVWRRATLPQSYRGCRADGKRFTEALRCETGQELYTWAGRYFGIPGARIFVAEGALADDPQFRKMHRVCRA